jgi:rod shape determining protein RodA
VFAEEWGFVGCATLAVLYGALILRGLQIVARAKDRFGSLLAFGVVAMIFWQAFVNIAMTTGLLPVVGITLPFFSYGGSSMITLMLGIGLLLNVSMRRFTF